MKGYWHFPALAAAASILTIIFHSYWITVVFFLWLLFLFYFRRLRKIPIVFSVISCLFFFTFIPDLDMISLSNNDNPSKHVQTQIYGQITSSINESKSKIDFVLQDKHSGNKLLIVYFKNKKEQKQKHKLKYGSTCYVSGKRELPDSSRNPGQFDYQGFLLSKGIRYQVIIRSLEDLECRGSSTLNKIYTIRDNLISYVTEQVSPRTAAWLNALVLGDDTLLSEDTVTLFQRWNLSHLLAISGLHVGLIVGLVYFILIKLNIMTKEKAQWIVIFFLPFYAFLAGGEPSVWRASTMVLLFMVVRKLKVKFSATDVLSIVFIVLLIFNKYIVYSIGFQLSFIVTLGLLLSKKWLLQSNSPFFTILKISFVSQMMILPLQITYFSTFQPLSILLNVVVVPYFSLFVIPFMFILLLLSPLGIFTSFMDQLFVQLHDLFISFLEVIDQIAYFPLALGSFTLTGTVIYYVLYLSLMNKAQREESTQAFKYGCCLVLLIIGIAIGPYLSPVGSVTMLDIGQGDAIVIELPYRKGVILIDAGARMSYEDNKLTDSVYKQVIKPYLLSKGIQEIDAIIITHGDTDHMGSVPFILQEIDVNSVIVNNYYVFNEKMMQSLDPAATKIKRVESGDQLHVGGQRFYVLSPYKDNGSTNENSVVLFALIGGRYWLFTGDIGKETELDIVEMYHELKVDVLKVAHHGSDTSTEPSFLKLVQPRIAMISVGANNSYGHPSQEVLKTLKESHTIILRTDKQGAIQYFFKGNGGTFKTYIP